MLNRVSALKEPSLVELLRSRDPEATSRFVRENAGWMLGLARRYVKDEALAEDCVQESFCCAFRAIDRFEGRCELRSWLHRIVVNAALMRLRTSTRQCEEPIDDIDPGSEWRACRCESTDPYAPTPEQMVLQAETRAVIAAKINELSDNHRVVLLLRDIEDVATEDVARLLGLSESAVKVRLHRARLALRKLLEPLLDGGLSRASE